VCPRAMLQVSGGIDGTKLQLGDVLIRVDGVLLEGKGIKELGQLLRGQPRSVVSLELHRGWAQIPIKAELQRRGRSRRQKPPLHAAAGVQRGSTTAGRVDNGRARDPSFRELPDPVLRETPKRTAGVASAAAVASAASRNRPPPPPDMGPLPAPGSRRPSPQSSVAWSPNSAKGHTESPAHSGHGVLAAQKSAVSPNRSPPFITPVASQVSVNSVSASGAASPATSENIVHRLSRQVERLDAEVKKKEKEKRELKGLLQERDKERRLVEEEANRLRLELADSADVHILKQLRARVQGLEADVHQRDEELAERSEHIGRLQRQLGATSAAVGG
jgi:hypothetical protein